MADLTALYREDATFDEHVEAYQELVDTGQAWMLEGSVGREAMRLIDEGYITVGVEAHRDYYGNRIPAIADLVPGSPGTPEYVDEKTQERNDH